MKKQSFYTFQSQLWLCLQSHPVELTLGVFFFCFQVMTNGVDYTLARPMEELQLFFPVLFAVTYACNHWFTGRLRAVYYASFLLLAPLILWASRLHLITDSIAYPCTLLLAFFLLIGHRRCADNLGFARHSVRMVVNGALSFCTGLLLYVVCIALYASVIYIFSLPENNHFFGNTFFLILYIAIPLLFCHLQQAGDNRWLVLPRAMQLILNFILSPAILLYTMLLYLYLFSILWHWELPKGGIAYMVMAFIFFSLAGNLSQLIVSRRYYDWFYRRFTLIAVPPLLLFWIGTVHRLAAYGFTESRVYLLAAGVLMTLYVGFLPFRRLGSYRLMLLISSAAIGLLTYIPGISAKRIGEKAQLHRMETLARKLSLWNADTHRIILPDSIVPTDTLRIRQVEELSSAYRYVARTLGEETMKIRYGEDPSERFTHEKNPIRITKSKDGEIMYLYPSYYTFHFPLRHIPLTNYTTLISKAYWIRTKNDVITLYDGENSLFSFNEQQHFAPHVAQMDKWKNHYPEDAAAFRVEVGSYVIIFRNIVYSDGKYHFEDSYPLVFQK
ncbi:MAG: DUF4153 domain-containing protein [Prevotellaceae bacterium]|jgi:hypothetical protein|nr:DUF4153 domain-containing protein [Prevotellaceae bacterium]